MEGLAKLACFKVAALYVGTLVITFVAYSTK